MREQQFIRDNISKWERAETVADQAAASSPDELAETYVDITADLSFAQTHYPDSRVTVYLNGLSASLHNVLYRNKRERSRRFFTFWTHEVPLTLYEARRLLLASFLIFILSVAIGAFSQRVDPDFCRLILGDSYMDMTQANIAAGKPMGVYGNEAELSMFGSITVNNILVALRLFVMGLLTSIVTGMGLFYNGIMIGCFDTFFAQQHLLGSVLLTTMLHGTLELSAIVVAGTAGLALGNGWLFPGTYSRLYSLRIAAKRGLKIVVSTVPVFIVAGFIESFITRHADLPAFVRLGIILLSAAFVIYYYVVLPFRVHHKSHTDTTTTHYE